MKANRYHGRSGFTMIELMIVVTIIGLLASVASAAFQSYILRSKTTEAVLGVSKIADGQIAYHSLNTVFVEAGPTPEFPSPQKQRVNFQEADARWQLLNFSISDAVQFSYQALPYTSLGAVGDEPFPGPADGIDCMAWGDLDGDGDVSSFRRRITPDETGQLQTSGLFIFDELE